MIYDRRKLYDCADDYFFMGGSGGMPLTTEAAIDVCKRAIEEELVILGVDGGKWHNPGFQPDGYSMWEARITFPVSLDEARKINLAAIEQIHCESKTYGVFIITSSSIKVHWKRLREMLKKGLSSKEIMDNLGLSTELNKILEKDTVTVHGPKYYDGKYVVINNRSGEIVCVTDYFDPAWENNDRIRLNI